MANINLVVYRLTGLREIPASVLFERETAGGWSRKRSPAFPFVALSDVEQKLFGIEHGGVVLSLQVRLVFPLDFRQLHEQPAQLRVGNALG